MPSLGLPPAIAADSLELTIPVAGGTKVYSIPPISAADFWKLRALDLLWGNVGRGRLKSLTQAPPDEVAKLVTDDPVLQESIVEVMESKLTAKQTIAMPLSKDVSDAMLADGVLDVHYKLAAATALAWHLTGDREAAEAVWLGKNPGNRAARRQTNSTNTGGANGTRRATGNGTNSPRKSKNG